MDGFLRQSTAKTIRIGPFLDWSDASTAENALSIGFSDIYLSKAGGAFAAKSDVTAPVSDGTLGYYSCELATQDVATVGLLKVHAAIDEALPIWHDFSVLPANQYDALFSDTGEFRTNVVEAAGTTVNSASDFRLIASDVWSVAARTLTAATNLNIPTSDQNAVATWANGTRTLSADTNINYPTSDENATAVWAKAARTLTAATNLNIPTSDQNAVATWAAGSRSLTALGGAASDFFLTDTGQDYSDAVAGSVVAEIATNVVATASVVMSDFFMTDSGKDYSDAVAGSVVKEIATNVTATASVAMSDFFLTDSGKDYSDAVAGSVVKEITDNATAVVDSDAVATAVWANAARTLTAATNITLSGSALSDTAGIAKVNTTQVSGTAQTAGDIVALVGNIATVGAPSYEASSSFTDNGSTVTETNDYTYTDTTNQSYHVLTPDATAINGTYHFTLGGDEQAVSITFHGRLYSSPTSSRTVAIQAWDWTAGVPAFVTVATINAVNTDASSADITLSELLVAKYTGTGDDLGKVDIRVLGASLTASTPLYVDQLLLGKTNTSRSVGYADGSVWVDTNNGTAGTEAFVNGTADNPVLTWADAQSIATSVGLNSFRFIAGSSVTLDASAANKRFIGSATIALGGQAITNALFKDAYSITGVSSGQDATFYDCGIGTASTEHAYFNVCRFTGTFTMLTGTTKDWFFIDCTDAVSGGAGGNATFVNVADGQVVFRDWRGGLQLNNHKATNSTIIDGAGRLIIDATSDAGSITIRGDFPPATGYAAFEVAGTITQTQRFGTDQTFLADVESISTSSPAADNLEAMLTGGGITGDVDLTLRSLTITNDEGVGMAITGTTYGVTVEATTGTGMTIESKGGDGYGLYIGGEGAGHGFYVEGGATGHGLYCIGGSTSGDGIYAAGQTLGHGMTLVFAGTSRYDLNADIKGDITGTVSGNSTHVASDIWSAATRTLTAGTNINYPSSDSIATAVSDAVWGATTRTLTSGTNLNIPTSDNNATAVWAATTRTLTTPSSDFKLEASDVWAVTTRTISTNIPTSDAIADAVLKTDVSDVQDSASEHSLTTLVLAATESSISGSDWTIKKTDGTTFVTKTITSDADASPITGVT